MSAYPSGQQLLWRYQTPLNGGDLAQVNADILYEGIYAGLLATAGGGAVVSVSAGACLIYDSATYGTAAAKMVKAVFSTGFNYTCNSTDKYRYVVLRYTWADALENYVQVLDVATPEDYDIILCAIEWNGSSISLVDADSATLGFREKFDTVILNLAPTADASANRTVQIAAGRFVFSHTSQSYAGGSVQLDTSASGRYDLISIDSSGTIVVTKGAEGGDKPSFTSMLPICYVHVRAGVASFLQSDILDVRPFLTFGGVFSPSDIDVSAGGYSHLISSALTLQDILSWMDTAFFDGTVLVASSLQGVVPVSAIGATDATVPTSKAVKDHVSARELVSSSFTASSYLSLNDSGYAKALSRITFLINRDVGKVAYFAGTKALSTGWIRADGATIDKVANVEYTALVDLLRATAADIPTHPFYHADVGKAKLPDLSGRYMKDVGISELALGTLIAGGLVQHSHSAVIASASPDTHVHAIPHTHAFTAGTGAAAPDASVSLPKHNHVASAAPHTHNTQINKGIKNPVTAKGVYGAFEKFDYVSTWSAVDDAIQSGPERDAGGNLLALPITIADAPADTLDGSVASHSHSLPATGSPSPGNSSTAAPNTHTHDITVDDEGTLATNEVSHTVLKAYIYFGVPAALM